MRASGWLLGASALALLVWWSVVPSVSVSRSGEARPPSAARAAEEPARLDPPSSGSTPHAQRSALGDEESSAAASSRFAAPHPGGDELRVLVRHASSREPAPDLDVQWIELGDSAGLRYRIECEQNVDRALAFERWCSTRRTDEAGYVRIPRPVEELVVLARSGGARGSLSIEAGDAHGSHVLELVEQGEFAVRVVDAQGAPRSDVRVGLGRGGEARTYEWTSTSDERGLARCENFRDVAEATRSSRFSVALAYPMRELVEQTIDPRAPRHEPLVLVLPPAGSLSVVVLDEHGERVQVDGFIGVTPHLHGALNRLRGSISGGTVDALEQPYPVVAGRAECPYVGLGLELVLMPRIEGFEWVMAKVVRGPSEPGERVEVELRLGAGLQQLWARAVDARTKQPLARAHLQVGYEYRAPLGFEAITTDEGGRFELDVPPSPLGAVSCPPETLIVHTDERGSRRAWSGMLSRTDARPDGFLGDFELHEDEPVFTGRVYDPSDGAGLAHAAVLWREAPRGDPGEPASHEAISIDEFARANRVECGTDGRFAVYGWSYSDSFELVAVHGTYAIGTPLTVSRGAFELQLPLVAGADVSGSFELRASADPRELHCVLVSEPGPGQHTSVRLSVADDGSFARDGLPPGRYSLAIAPDEHAPVCHRIDGIELRPGEHARDPRLQGIDLREVLSCVDVHVRGPSGAPIHYAEVFLLESEGGSLVHRQRPASFEGRASFLTAHSSVDVVVIAKGFRAERVRAASGEVHVRLRPGLEIAFEFAQLEDKRRSLYVYTSFVAGASEVDTSLMKPCLAEVHPQTTFQTGSAPGVLMLPAPGRWNVMVQEWRGADWEVVRAPDREYEQAIDVLEVEGQSFALRFDPQSIDPPAKAGR